MEMIYTSGSGETLQPVISGGVDLGLAVGTLGAMAAYSKGAPVRIVGAQATGAADYWYAKNAADQEAERHRRSHHCLFRRNGSSTNSVVRAFIDEYKLTGANNSDDWQPQFHADRGDDRSGRRRLGFTAVRPEGNRGRKNTYYRQGNDDAALVRGQTIRVLVANTDTLTKRKEVLKRFMQAYREAIDYMYSDNAASHQGLRRICRCAGSDGQSECAMSSSRKPWSIQTSIMALRRWCRKQ